MTNLITLAGRGHRFSIEGYNVPKPLIKVNDDYMIHEAIKCLPKADKYVFVCLREHVELYKIDEILLKKYINSEIIVIDEVTEGQACTAEIGINGSSIDLDESLLISSCDYGLEWDEGKYKAIDADVIVWTTIHNRAFSNNPSSYSWLDVDGDKLLDTYVKQKVFDDSYNNHAIVGTFYFKKAKYFIDGVKKIYESDIRSNGEFYIDNIFNTLTDLDVKIFDVDKYHCWGTPEDLKNYEN
jgi:NDP-sugar pyrophosphorylase family protein